VTVTVTDASAAVSVPAEGDTSTAPFPSLAMVADQLTAPPLADRTICLPPAPTSSRPPCGVMVRVPLDAGGALGVADVEEGADGAVAVADPAALVVGVAATEADAEARVDVRLVAAAVAVGAGDVPAAAVAVGLVSASAGEA
jgi:hypothetical protein